MFVHVKEVLPWTAGENSLVDCTVWSGFCNKMTFMASYITNTDNTRLSRCEMVIRQDCLRLKISKQFYPVNAVWTDTCLVLTQFPIALNSPTVTSFGNWVKTSSQMRSHRRQDKTVLSPILKTVCDCREVSWHRRQDKTRESCPVGVCGVYYSH